MMLFKRAMAILGTAVVIAAIVALVTPKTAHAIVATAVQVVNTSAQPVLTFGTEAHSSFVAQGNCTFGAGAAQLYQCIISDLYRVPGGEIAVIESATGLCQVDGGTRPVEFRLEFISPAGSFITLQVPTTSVEPFSGSTVFSAAGQGLKSYASGSVSGNSINLTVDVNANQTSGTGDYCRFNISGHLAPQ